MNNKQTSDNEEDRNPEPPMNERLPGVHPSQFGPAGEWELVAQAPRSPDDLLGSKGSVTARFTISGSKIVEGIWIPSNEVQESFEGSIVYHMKDLEDEDPRLIGIRLELIFENSERFSCFVPTDEIVHKTFYGKDEAGRKYTLKCIENTQS